MTPEDVRDRLESVRRAGRELRRRPRADRLAALGRVLDRWSDPDSEWRRALAAELPTATGFSPATVLRGLEVGLDGWTGEALLELAERELDADQIGFDSTAVVLAGSIPMPTLLSLIAPLAAGSPVVARAAARDRVTPAHVARSIAEADAGLGRCVQIVDFPRSDLACTQALLNADCVCATGSDATIAALQAIVRPPRRTLFDGHRLSVTAVGDEVRTADQMADTARRIALDVALWDQLGCLSPVAVFAVGAALDPADDRWIDAFSQALATALAAAERAWPRGEIGASAARDVARERAESELRSAAGHRVRLFCSASTAWTLVREDRCELRPAPLHRFIRVLPTPGTDGLLAALQPIGPHLAAVALEGFGARTGDLSRELAALGASRICRPGALQSPPIGWHHAGRRALGSLARYADVELPAQPGAPR